jgi:Na+(H+)/acetate symporter ActP
MMESLIMEGGIVVLAIGTTTTTRLLLSRIVRTKGCVVVAVVAVWGGMRRTRSWRGIPHVLLPQLYQGMSYMVVIQRSKDSSRRG